MQFTIHILRSVFNLQSRLQHNSQCARWVLQHPRVKVVHYQAPRSILFCVYLQFEEKKEVIQFERAIVSRRNGS